jgi:hypothetical protein
VLAIRRKIALKDVNKKDKFLNVKTRVISRLNI